jgi:hypothetical protein
MALVKCPACKAEISAAATSCPKCGHPMPRKTSAVTMGCAIVIAIAVAGMIFMGVVTAIFGDSSSRPSSARRTQPAKQSDEQLRASLCEQAKDAVRDRLKAPSTADFPGCVFGANEYEIRRSADGKQASVIGHVDAQNAFGAKLRTKFVVMFKADPAKPGKYVVSEVAVE